MATKSNHVFKIGIQCLLSSLVWVVPSLPRVACSQALGVPKVTFQGPLVISKGGTYSGNWKSSDLSHFAVTIQTTEPVILENCIVTGPADLIYSIAKVDLTIRNCKGYGVRGDTHANRFATVAGAKRLIIENNYLEHTSGLNLVDMGAATAEIRIRKNVVRNIDCRNSSGAEGWCNFIGFDKVSGVSNIEVAWNQVVNDPGNSNVMDVVNFYQSGGTAANVARFHDNYIQGAYPVDPSQPEFAGTGFITDSTGDGSGVETAYIDAYDNQFVSIGNTVMSIAHGHDIHYYRNRIVSSGILPYGKKIRSSFAGMQIANYYGAPQFYANTMRDQITGYVTPAYDYAVPVAGRNDWRSDGHCLGCGTGITYLPNPITPQTEYAEWVRWKQKVADNQIQLGANGQGPGTENLLFAKFIAVAPSPSPSPSSGTWTTIGYEGQTVVVPANSLLRYGANTSFVQKVASGTVEISNTFFGSDPAFGLTKITQIFLGAGGAASPSPSPSPASQWVTIGYEGQTVTVPTGTTVRYGANDRYIQKVVSGTFPISNTFFGTDPVPGITKIAQKLVTTSLISPPAGSPRAISGLTLINADSDQPQPLSGVAGTSALITNGATIDLALVGRSLNLKAEVTDAASVRFDLNGVVGYRIENQAPFSLQSDTNGDYHAWSPAPGLYTVTATAFSGKDGTGTPGPSVTVQFRVK